VGGQWLVRQQAGWQALTLWACGVVAWWVSGCQSFSSLWYFASAKHVSSISSRFLIHRVYAVCVCVLVTILDPPHWPLNQKFKTISSIINNTDEMREKISL
jgi:hypothetical protein